MDALTLLKDDHRRVEALFSKFEGTGNRAFKTREKLAASMIEELSVHAVIEEQVFYPAIRKAAPNLSNHVLEAIEEHHIVKWTLSELDNLEPSAENYAAKVAVLTELVRHHVEEEEKDVFPAVRKAMKTDQLNELGEQLAAAKLVAPTSPHPRAPSSPPADTHDLVVNAAEKVVAMKDRLVGRLSQ